MLRHLAPLTLALRRPDDGKLNGDLAVDAVAPPRPE